MPDLETILSAAFLGLASVGAMLHVFAAIQLSNHLRGNEDPAACELPPLTLWRAVKPGVPDLAAKLEALLQASRPGDQLLLGADAGSAEFALCESLQSRNPERDIIAVPCVAGRAENPKISKFAQMAPVARHEHWLLTDAEALPDEGFIERIRSEWTTSGADVVTAGYRFIELRNFPQALDAASTLLTFWPGLMLAGRIIFTLGACTGVKASDVRAIGGWESLGDLLAEDHQLGHELARKGRTIRLSRAVLSLGCDPIGWTDLLRHQHRVAVTYRVANPSGTLGLPILHVVGLVLVALALRRACWPWAVVVLLIRYGAAFRIASVLSFPLRWGLLTALAGSIIESVMWILSWLPLPVWWSGRWRRVNWRGRFLAQG